MQARATIRCHATAESFDDAFVLRSDGVKAIQQEKGCTSISSGPEQFLPPFHKPVERSLRVNMPHPVAEPVRDLLDALACKPVPERRPDAFDSQKPQGVEHHH